LKFNAVISKPSLKLDFANKTASISFAVIILGIITGTIIFWLSEDVVFKELYDYFISYTTDFSDKNKPEIISGLILSNIPYYIFMLILGTSVVGIPGAICLTFVRSMGMGFIVTYIYDKFALKGIEFSLLVFLPGKFIMILAMILLTQSCLITSQTIRKSLVKHEDRVVPFHKFILRSLIIILLFMSASIMDFLTLNCFSTLFDFT
jgi:uncharacterized membrane protein SpoIIM required for sporulation